MRFILLLSMLFLTPLAPALAQDIEGQTESIATVDGDGAQETPDTSQDSPPEETPAPAVEVPAPAVKVPDSAAVDKDLLHKEPVTLEGSTYFTLYQKGGDPAELKRQAQEASEKLARAMANTTLEAAKESLRFESSPQSLDVYISELQIISIKRHHLQAAGLHSFDLYKKEIDGQITNTINDRINKAKWQRKAKTFFLTFFFLAVGLLILGQLSRLFERAEENLLERKERFQSISLFSETLIQGQTVGAFLTFALVVGRVLAYIIVVVISLLAVLSQFEGSQTVLSDFFKHLAELTVDALQSLVEAIPSILLALILVLALYFGLKIASLYLRSLAIGRVRFKALPPGRLPVARFWAPLILFLIFLPFIVSALLTVRFSSLEIGVITFGVVTLLGFLPLFAGAAIGSYVVWNGHIKEGQWVEIGPFHGEVTRISLFEISVVPEDGGVIRIPMVYLMFKPSHVRLEVPKFEIRFTLRKMGSLDETLKKIADLFPEKWNVEVTCQSVNQTEVKVLVRARKFESQIKSQALQILSDACDSKAIELTSEFVEEIVH